MAGWKLILEQPLEPFQQRMYARYTTNLYWVCAIFLAALAAAELVSRKALQPIADLRRISCDLPTQISSGTAVAWPESTIVETKQLMYNFREMAGRSSPLQFHHIRKMNAELELRVVERTRELQESEERFRTLFEKVKVVSLIIAPGTGSIVDANSAAEQYYGWPRERLLQMNISDLNTGSPVAIREKMIEAQAEKRSIFQFRHRRADGTVRDVEVYSGPIETLGGTLLYSIVHDVTERKRAEEALRRSEVRLSRAQHVARIGNWEWDIKTNELSWSDEVFRLYGIDPVAEKPSYDIVLKTLAPECRERFASSIQDALQKGKYFEGEYRIILPDGESRYTHTAGEVARDGSGAPVSMFGVVQDITERKQSEERLRQLANEQRVILDTIAIGVLYARNRELVWANRSLYQ